MIENAVDNLIDWAKAEVKKLPSFAGKFALDLGADLGEIAKRSVGIIEEKEQEDEERDLSVPPGVINSKGVKFGYGLTNWSKKTVKFKQGDFRHKIVQGGTGAGKSTWAVNYSLNLVENDRGFAYLDVKDGKAINDILKCLPEDKLSDVILLDHSNKRKPIGVGNFEAEGDIFQQNLITSQWVDFFCQNYGIKEQFRTQELIRYACRATFALKNTTLWDVVKIVDDQEYREYILDKLDSNKHKDVLKWWKEFNKKSESQQDHIAASFKTRASIILSNPILKTTLGQTPKRKLDYNKWINQGKIVLIHVPLKYPDQIIRSIAGLHILGFWQAIVKRSDMPERKRNPYMILADEPQTWLSNNEKTVQEIFSKARSYKVGLIPMFQSSEQIGEISNSLLKIIIDNQPDLFQFKCENSFLNIGDFDINEIKDYQFVARINGKEPFLGKGFKPSMPKRTMKEVRRFKKDQKRKWNRDYKEVLRRLENRLRRAKRWQSGRTNEKKSGSRKTGLRTSASQESQTETEESSNSSMTIDW